MGGLAFARPGKDGPALHTPRMSIAEYTVLKEQCLKLLAEFYHEVACPAEAPAKVDHGDIDVLVQGPRYEVGPHRVAERLGARRYLECGHTCSYAIPLLNREDVYAQLDVHACPSGHFAWELFMHSYGDLWQILAVLYKDAGLKANDKGLHVLVPEIETVSRKAQARMLCLTNDPETAMEFLGLDVAEYRRGFKNIEEMFQWCTSGRCFSLNSIGKRYGTPNERRRMGTRKVYAQFVAEWIPSHPEVDERQRQQIWSREDVLAGAIRWFGREHEHRSMVRVAKLEKKEDELWVKIAAEIPLKGDKLNLVIRGLKRWVRLDEGRARLCEEPDMDNDLRPLWTLRMAETDEPVLLDWIKGHWEEVKIRERKRISDAKAARQEL